MSSPLRYTLLDVKDALRHGRDAVIRRMDDLGYTAAEIALCCGVSRSRVGQLVNCHQWNKRRRHRRWRTRRR